jgi:hypothetical protein
VFRTRIFKRDHQLFFMTNERGGPVALHACSFFCWNLSCSLQIIFLRILCKSVRLALCPAATGLRSLSLSLSGGLPHMKYCFAALRLTAKIFHYEWTHLASWCKWRLSITFFSRFKLYTNSNLLHRTCFTCKMLEILVSPLNVLLICIWGHGKSLLQKRRLYLIWMQFQLYCTMCATHARTQYHHMWTAKTTIFCRTEPSSSRTS